MEEPAAPRRPAVKWEPANPEARRMPWSRSYARQAMGKRRWEKEVSLRE